jgi:hypothetical protein
MTASQNASSWSSTPSESSPQFQSTHTNSVLDELLDANLLLEVIDIGRVGGEIKEEFKFDLDPDFRFDFGEFPKSMEVGDKIRVTQR